MKKAIFIVCLFVLGATTQAQIISSSSKKVTTTKNTTPSNISWYFKAGLNSMKFTGDEESDDWKRKLGYKFDLGFKKPISSMDMLTVYWGMDFSLGSRGYKYEYSYYNNYRNYGDYEVWRLCHNVQWAPINIGANINLLENLILDAHIGAYISGDYLVTDKTKYETYYSNGDEKDSYWFDGPHAGDVGINFGLGIWYDKFNIEFGWQKGFVDYGGDIHTNNLLFKIGFML
ncbi:MAG: PorT family protein [Bacteroidales bacterium]|nr:PorT family protein [Bacteroidales bacterium]